MTAINNEMRHYLEAAVRERAERLGRKGLSGRSLEISFRAGAPGFHRDTLWRALELATMPRRARVEYLNDQDIEVLAQLWRDSPAAPLPANLEAWQVGRLVSRGLAVWGRGEDGVACPDVTWAGVCELRARGVRK